MNEWFGGSVAVSGNTVVVGRSGRRSAAMPNGGGLRVHRAGSGWKHDATAKLTASDDATDESFGCSVSISGNTVVVGADDPAATSSGNLATRGRPTCSLSPPSVGPMTETTKLTASDGTDGRVFGYSVSISGNTVVVGAHRATAPPASAARGGAAYVFTGPAPIGLRPPSSPRGRV